MYNYNFVWYRDVRNVNISDKKPTRRHYKYLAPTKTLTGKDEKTR